MYTYSLSTGTWAYACTSTYVHSTWKPERPSYPTSIARGRMDVMLSFMRIRTCTCACTYTWECECSYTHTCMYMCSAYKQRKSSYQKLTPKHKGKNQNGHHAKHANFTRCVHTSPIPMPRLVRVHAHVCKCTHTCISTCT